jgi:hypothetical protein
MRQSLAGKDGGTLTNFSGRSWAEVFYDIQKIQEMDGQGRGRGNKGTKEQRKEDTKEQRKEGTNEGRIKDRKAGRKSVSVKEARKEGGGKESRKN